MPIKTVICYVPVPHRGYREFFSRHRDAGRVYLVDDGLQSEFSHLRKNLPALSVQEVRAGIALWGWVRVPVMTLNHRELEAMRAIPESFSVVMPDEDICRAIAEKYLPGSEITWDSYFLRWDRQASLAQRDVSPDGIVSVEEFDRSVIGFLDKESAKSPDFWRQLAAAVVKDGRVLFHAWNGHVPDPEMPYIYGDPRFNFSRGVEIDRGTAEHAESRLIAESARVGQALEGTWLYVTTFPCQVCAKSIARAGFARCYYRHGYTNVDAETVLRASGVELIRVL